MNTEELKPMIEFILEIDFMSTKDFCDKYNVPHPVYTGEVESSANQFLQIDAIKHRLFVEHAKKIRKAPLDEQKNADKSAEEVLKETFKNCGAYLDPSTKSAALIAMREFASQFQQPTESDAEEFAEFTRDYIRVRSESLNKVAYVHESHGVYVHGSDIHYTSMIEKHGKSMNELYIEFKKRKQ